MNAIDILKYGHLTLSKSINGLPEADWTKGGVCGVWSVKDIMAHLASYEQWLNEILASVLDGGDILTLQRMAQHPDDWNDVEVSARSHLTVEQILAEYNEKQAQNMTLAARIPAETWRQNGTLSWYGPEYSLDDFIVYTFYGHKREHSAQIDHFRTG
jgi:hypothetical protein